MASSEVNGIENVQQRKQLYLKVRPFLKENSSKHKDSFSSAANEWVK
jgi:hypothetical protein